jgi:hypothetical protein
VRQPIHAHSRLQDVRAIEQGLLPLDARAVCKFGEDAGEVRRYESYLILTFVVARSRSVTADSHGSDPKSADMGDDRMSSFVNGRSRELSLGRRLRDFPLRVLGCVSRQRVSDTTPSTVTLDQVKPIHDAIAL